METIFYIVRHGQTLFNVLGRYQGWCDSPLTDDGIELAEKLHDGLMDIPFALAASSTSERAVDTLDCIVKDRPIKIVHHKGLREQYFGRLEGSMINFSKPPREVQLKGYRWCGGEDFMDTVERFIKALDEIKCEGNVLVASHGAVIHCFLRYLIPDMPYYRVRDLVPNCSITKVSYKDGKFEILEMPSLKYMK